MRMQKAFPGRPLRRAEPEFAMYWERAMHAHRRIAAGVPFWEVLAGEAASGGVH